ncbi:hypothetical protein CEXT_396891 [Caerostris extrusa]|uniref:Uncharacterized protein n=1 Tax=Caerostris extrusa TaxID=172846 RepID=A0AAV4Q8R1_CAEEX|nr:hypothetical protein CEXT_396891 [Caerostris extrusa]
MRTLCLKKTNSLSQQTRMFEGHGISARCRQGARMGRRPPAGYRPRVGGSPIPHAALLSWVVLPRHSSHPLYDSSNAPTALREQMVLAKFHQFMSTFCGDLTVYIHVKYNVHSITSVSRGTLLLKCTILQAQGTYPYVQM